MDRWDLSTSTCNAFLYYFQITSTNGLNLHDILQNWVENTGEYRNKKVKLNLSKVKFEDGPAIFKNKAKSQDSSKTQVIFEDVFRNGTDCPQKHRVRCERQTTSFAKFDLSRGIIYEDKHLLKVYDLPKNCEASGFTTPMTMSQLGGEEFIEMLNWSVDDEITVPPNSTMHTDVIVCEQVQETDFQIKTKIRGNVHCDVVDVQNDSFFRSVDGNIYEILYNHKEEEGNIEGLEFEKGSVSFISKGTCKFRYGVSNFINVRYDEHHKQPQMDSVPDKK